MNTVNFLLKATYRLNPACHIVSHFIIKRLQFLQMFYFIKQYTFKSFQTSM